ncbi:MAG TPA: phospho-N-acetylmuramoyl-pentapeptide-transferase [Sulfurospirillum sp. UBA12182]|jgi:phospho-N-acetylmuramoyl-pentapeptide-transferase|nr:MAG TPA: phospho-N-acetylmuramoyl-pentapeptide-transferase [Sulfurospirillum sp. UBA12182]
MLYWFYELTSLNILQYITVRAGIAFFLSFLLSIFVIPKFIRWAKAKNAKQPIYSLAPKSHQGKSNTPTMGGAFFISSTLFASILCVKLDNVYAIGGIMTLLLFGLIGVKDDISKILGNKNEAGLSKRGKLFLQSISALLVSTLIFFGSGVGDELYVPFYKYPILEMEWFALIFWVLVIISSSNAVNLTDGLDGLATVPSIFSLLSLSTFVYIAGHAGLSSYLLLPKISNSGEVVIIAAALIGSLVGFLWYNCYPAELFMGDSGSLSIGAFIAYMAIISKNEILLILIGFVFVLETVSVILQVGSFKTRKKRIFLMAPIHHHFEIKGWAENKIIVRFWIIALMSNLLALMEIKLR